MKKILCAIVALFLIISLSSCVEITEKPTNPTNTQSLSAWTVLIYLCGSDLESENGAATDNLIEILDANIPEDVNVVIQTGGAKEWQNDIVDSTTINRFCVSEQSLIQVDTVENASMGSPDTLKQFLEFGIKNYPADKYMSLFWDHGGGSISGVAFDENYEDDSLTLNEIDSVFSSLNEHFELIGFDACLMATLETAGVFEKYASYMVASEEYEPGGGWDYKAWLNYLGNNVDCTGEDLGKEICTSYYNKCQLSGEESMATLSVIDLSKIGNLNSAFNAMSEEMTGLIGDVNNIRSISAAVNRSENYGGNTDDEGYTNMVDLGDIAKNSKDVLPETSGTVITAINEAVVYQINGANRSHANGISVFYPLSNDPEECESYSLISTNAAYLIYIDSIIRGYEAPDWVYEGLDKSDYVISDDYVIDFSTYVTDDNYFALSFDSGLEYVESVHFSLYYYDDEYEEFELLGIDDDIHSDWENGFFLDNFRGVWLTIGGYYCAPELITVGDTYNIYSIHILLNGEETNLRVAYDFDDEQYYIIDIYDGVGENGMSNRVCKELTDGDEITFLFDSYNSEEDEWYTYEAGTVTYYDGIEICESEIFNGEYLYMYEITDIFGNVSYSDAVIMEYEDGNIYIEEL